MEMFLVGGAVRDMLMGRRSKDWDFTVVLSDSDREWIDRGLDPFVCMRDNLADMRFEIFLADEQHMTVRARAPKGWTFAGMVPPVTTFDFVLARKDVSTDGRHAQTEPGTLLDDLARRDFTMNAIAMDSTGEFIDPFGGQQDISDRLIRTVGTPAMRFEEDGLRVLRAIRFAVVLGFDIDNRTGMAMSPNFIGPGVSVERVREELGKAFAFNTRRTVELLQEFRLFGLLFHGGKLWLKPTLEAR